MQLDIGGYYFNRLRASCGRGALPYTESDKYGKVYAETLGVDWSISEPERRPGADTDALNHRVSTRLNPGK